MKSTLVSAIKNECNKLTERHSDYLNALHEEITRKTKRYDKPYNKEVHTPEYWRVDKRFNPFYVRSTKRIKCYAHTITKQVKEDAYKPMPAIRHTINKSDGTTRVLNIFQLPDAALSRLVYKSLLAKNLHKLNSQAFAYREDRHAHDAIGYIYNDWKSLDRVFIAEFDFSKFFDNINHTYIYDCMESLDILATPQEKSVIKAFLNSSSTTPDTYSPTLSLPQRERGIPQGTSISLFLANLVCTELDKALERSGVGFVRYADDTIIWSQSYQKVVDAYELIKMFSERMAVPINIKKSEGISLLSRDGTGEIQSKQSINYLGYNISLNSISIKHSKVLAIKKRVSFIIYANLIQPLKNHTYNTKRLVGIDLDYIVTLNQLRRYLYGGLSSSVLKKYCLGDVKRINFRGLMSFYPLVNDNNQLQKLDGWLIYTLKQSLKLRESMWLTHSAISLPGPETNWIAKIDSYKKWRSPTNTIIYDLGIPSFSLINNAMKQSMEHYGLNSVVHPRSIYYSD